MNSKHLPDGVAVGGYAAAAHIWKGVMYVYVYGKHRMYISGTQSQCGRVCVVHSKAIYINEENRFGLSNIYERDKKQILFVPASQTHTHTHTTKSAGICPHIYRVSKCVWWPWFG